MPAARSAGSVTVQLTAGTAQFVRDMALADGTVKKFGQSSLGLQSSLGGSRTSMVAASTSVRILEGNVTGATRAVGRFLADTLKLGPVLQAAFPVIGAVALIGVIEKIGEGIVKFFNDVKEAPHKLDAAFRPAIQSIIISNDELHVANDRLLNDIAKLEGHRQNTLKLTLDEARLAADKLADSIDKDLSSLEKLLNENSLGRLKGFFTGQASTHDDEERVKNFTTQLAQIDREGAASVRSAKSKEDASRAQDTWNKHTLEALDDQIKKYSTLVSQTQKLQDLHEGKGNAPTYLAYQEDIRAGTNKYTGYNTTVTTADQSVALKARQNTLDELNAIRDRIAAQTQNTSLTQRKSDLEANAANAGLERPYDDRIKELQAQLQGSEGKLSTVAASDAMKSLTEANAKYLEVIAQIAKVRERSKAPADAIKEATIKEIITTNQAVEAQTQWLGSLHEASIKTDERIASLDRLTAAIGKGYEATIKANVATQLAAEFAHKDPGFLTSAIGVAEFAARAQELTTEAYKANSLSIAQTVDKLSDQIEVERAVAAVQSQGAEAVRQVTLAEKIRQLTIANQVDEVGKLIQAERDLAEARQANATSESIAKLDEETFALKALTSAVLQGADARRRQEELSKENVLQRQGRDEEIPALRAQEAARYQLDLAEGVAREALARQDEISKLTDEIALIRSLSKEDQARLPIQIALRDLENQRLEALAKEELRIGSLKSGVEAFFLEMEASAKSAGQIIYDALHSAVDKVSDELTKLFTGQHASGTKLLKGIGEGLIKDAVGSLIHTGLGALGKKLGIHGPTDFKDLKNQGQDESTAWWVRIASNGKISPLPGEAGHAADIILGSYGGGANSPQGSDGGGGKLPGILGGVGGILGKLLGVLLHRADGGSVSPGQGYLVGERGPEPFFPSTGGSIMSNALATRTFGGGGANYHIGNIDARGSDGAMVEQRVFRAMTAFHNSAIGGGVRATIDRSHRVPSGA